MSLQIIVTDPANTPRAELFLVISLLQRFHDDTGRADAPPIPTVPLLADPLGILSGPRSGGTIPADLPGSLVGVFTTFGGTVNFGDRAPGTINPADLPDAGLAVVSPQQAFAPDPAAAFGAVPNAPPAPSTAAVDPSLTAPAAPAPTSIPAAPALVPPAPSSAPALAAAAPGASSPADLDKNGLPWDAEIHASSKVKNADGTWRAKRGVDPALVEQRTAQLRQLMAIPAGGGVPNVPPQPPTAATAPVITPPAPVGAPAAVSPPNAAPAPAAPGASPSDFVTLMQKLGPLVLAGKLAQPELVSICQQHGLADLTMLQPRPDLVPLVNASIDALLLARG